MRKRIGVITACPENDYQHRVLSGIRFQANAYNYDIFVFSPLAHVTSNSKEHVKGELNIFSLINYELLDAIIIMPIALTEDSDTSIVNALLEQIKAKCKVPVVSIDIPFGDYPVIRTDEKSPFTQITDHLIEVHGCKNIAVLNGPADYDGSKIRLDGIEESMQKHGLNFNKDNVVVFPIPKPLEVSLTFPCTSLRAKISMSTKLSTIGPSLEELLEEASLLEDASLLDEISLLLEASELEEDSLEELLSLEEEKLEDSFSLKELGVSLEETSELLGAGVLPQADNAKAISIEVNKIVFFFIMFRLCHDFCYLLTKRKA